MGIQESLRLIKQYGNCPECGNDRVGNGEGTLVIKAKLFSRTCKCGWSIQVADSINRNR